MKYATEDNQGSEINNHSIQYESSTRNFANEDTTQRASYSIPTKAGQLVRNQSDNINITGNDLFTSEYTKTSNNQGQAVNAQENGGDYYYQESPKLPHDLNNVTFQKEASQETTNDYLQLDASDIQLNQSNRDI